MEKFFESALNLVKSDVGIVTIVLIVAIMFAIITMSKRKKVTDSFSQNIGGEIDVKAKEPTDGVTIDNSGNGNVNSKINIEL